MYRTILTLFVLGWISSAPEALAQTVPSFLPPGYAPVFNDTFSGSTLDSSWQNDGTYLGQMTAYENPKAVSVDNGLTISTYTKNGINYDGLITTQAANVTFTYGYFQATMAFNPGTSGGSGIFSDFWLESAAMLNNPNPVPLSEGAEVDIIEHRYTPPASNPGNSDYAVHWNGYEVADQNLYKPFENAALDTGYHTYGVLWTPTSYTFYIDGTEIGTTTEGVSSGAEFMVLSAEVNSNFGGPSPTNGYGTLGSGNPQMMVSDVEVFQLGAPEPPTFALVMAGVSMVFVTAKLIRHRNGGKLLNAAFEAKIS